MKVVGVGLNKTGTKTLRAYCQEWGLRHRSYDLEAFHRFRAGDVEGVLAEMEHADSFEDWPWPLMFREIDARFPDARFVLTVRRSAEAWYRSLCKMAVRRGPLRNFEQHVYGHAMPQGHRDEHVAIYEAHNRAVAAHFRGRSGKLLEICWERGDDGRKLAEFLDQPVPADPHRHVNASPPVYAGDNLYLAHLNRVLFQAAWPVTRHVLRLQAAIRRRRGS